MRSKITTEAFRLTLIRVESSMSERQRKRNLMKRNNYKKHCDEHSSEFYVRQITKIKPSETFFYMITG